MLGVSHRSLIVLTTVVGVLLVGTWAWALRDSVPRNTTTRDKAWVSARISRYCGAPDGGIHGILGASGDLADVVQGKLVLHKVVVLMRHAARTPLNVVPGHTHPVIPPGECTLQKEDAAQLRTRFMVRRMGNTTVTTDTLIDAASEEPPCEGGFVIAEGFEHTRTIGAHYRSAYARTNVFASGFDPTLHVSITSTDYPRTVVSAAAFALGMFPPESWSLATTAVPIVVTPATEDPALAFLLRFAKTQCPRGGAAVLESLSRDLPADSWVNRMADIFGVSPEDVPTPTQISDALLYSNLCYNRRVPCIHGTCFDTTDMAATLREADAEYVRRFQSRKQAVLAYPILSQVLGAILSTARVSIFAMHDVTLAPILETLGIFDNLWPPFSAHLAFEVWGPPGDPAQHPDALRVRVLYNGHDSTTQLPCWLSDTASDMCTLPALKAFVRGLLGRCESWFHACSFDFTC